MLAIIGKYEFILVAFCNEYIGRIDWMSLNEPFCSSCNTINVR